jgi:hypothetical protein
MAAASSFSVDDGQSTPVSHLFAPARKDGLLVVFEERTTANNPLGFYSFATSQTSPKSSSAVIRTKLTLEVPLSVLDSSTGLYSYPSSNRWVVEGMIAKNATLAQRKDLYAYLKNIVSLTMVKSLFEDLDAIY